MICSENRKSVRKFLEDLLDEAEYQRVRRHIEHCGDCQKFVGSAGSISSMLMGMARSCAPDDLVDTVVYAYEKKRRELPVGPTSPRTSFAPKSLQADASRGDGQVTLKIVIAVLAVFLVLLAWKDLTQSQVSEFKTPLIIRQAPAVGAAVISTPPQAAIKGDFEWGNTVVHWEHGMLLALSALIRQFSAEVRYEAPGLIVIRIPASKQMQWRQSLDELPGVMVSQGDFPSSKEGDDRLYTVTYGIE